MKKPIVKNNESNPIPEEVIAEAIVKVADAFKKSSETRLARHTLVVLLQDRTGLTKTAINKVLDACLTLEKDYLKPLPTLKK